VIEIVTVTERGAALKFTAFKLTGVKARVILFALVLAASSTQSGRAYAADSCTAWGDAPATLLADPVPACPEGGSLLGPWPDSDGTDRYACVWTPANVSQSTPLPMVVFLHPSLYTADVIAYTNLLEYFNTAKLSAKARPRGYIVLAPEGRNTTHHYPTGDASGPGWDNWYRQFQSPATVPGNPPENVDAEAIDHFIGVETATGGVDPDRIYMTGWSNGAAMAYIYALNRPNIAAISVYSSPDPWAFTDDLCEQTPVAGTPASISEIQIADPGVPTLQVHNACDLAAICPNTERMEGRLRMAGVATDDVIIGNPKKPTDAFYQHRTRQCIAQCGTNPDGDGTNLEGIYNHSRWPTKWTRAMLAYMRKHPLNTRGKK